MVFHHDLMADTLALVEGNAVFSGKVTHFFMRCGGFRGIGRNIVIHDPYQLAYILNVGMFQFVVHIDGQMGGAIVAHQSVQLYGMDISGFGGVHTGCPGDDFFSHCHTHSSVLLVQ